MYAPLLAAGDLLPPWPGAIAALTRLRFAIGTEEGGGETQHRLGY